MLEEKGKNACSVDGCAGCSGCGVETDDEFDPIISLTDENGKDIQFEILDVVVIDDDQYLVVTEAGSEESDDKETEVTVLQIKDEDGDEVYDTVTDKDIAEKVFKKFQEQQDELDDDSEEDEEQE